MTTYDIGLIGNRRSAPGASAFAHAHILITLAERAVALEAPSTGPIAGGSYGMAIVRRAGQPAPAWTIKRCLVHHSTYGTAATCGLRLRQRS
jgi:hypothetical protein